MLNRVVLLHQFINLFVIINIIDFLNLKFNQFNFSGFNYFANTFVFAYYVCPYYAWSFCNVTV